MDNAGTDSIRQTLVDFSAGAPDDITALMIELAVTNGGVQLARAASDLLMDIKEANNAAEVIKICLDAPDDSVRQRAVEAIETLEGPEALEMLGQALASDDQTVRRAAVNTFGQIVCSKYHPQKAVLLKQLENADTPISRIIFESQDVGMKREISQVLGFADSNMVLPCLKKLSNEDDRQTRREAVLALAANGSEKAIALAKEKLDDPDDVTVVFVLDILASNLGRDSEEMLGYLKGALQHPLPEVRRHAVMMLNYFPLSKVESVLVEATKDKDFEVTRSAYTLLRSMGSSVAATILEAAMEIKGDEGTLLIWEAGNLGMESNSARNRSMLQPKDAISRDTVTKILQKHASEGTDSNRFNALTELIELQDIADSDVLKAALNDPQETIRHRVATALPHTRDAGLLVRLLAEHTDILIRRQAIDALMDNPSARTRDWRGRSGVTFTYERTQGMELYSHFLKSLGDPDEGVVQSACKALQQFIDLNCPLPMKTTMHRLNTVLENTQFSSLTHETVREVIDKLEGATPGKPLCEAIDGTLTAAESIKRYLKCLTIDDGHFRLSRECDTDSDEIMDQWPESLAMPEADIKHLTEAIEGGAPLPQDIAKDAFLSMCSRLARIYEAIYHGVQGLRGLQQNGLKEGLKTWKGRMEGHIPLHAQDGGLLQTHSGRLSLLQSRALISIAATLVASGEENNTTELEHLGAAGDWCRICELTARSELGILQPKGVENLKTLVSQHADDAEYSPVIAPAAVELLRNGVVEAINPLVEALKNVNTNLRAATTQRLMTASQEADVEDILRNYLSKIKRHNLDLGISCLRLAVIGATGETGDLPRFKTEGNNIIKTEPGFAETAICAMQNMASEAEVLKQMLREGEDKQRYLAATYLGLSRVQSAVPVFASVADQVDSPWQLRALCAGMMVRRGHRQSTNWFLKHAQHGTPAMKAETAINFGQAYEDILPMMLQCKNVNCGRFV
jgi:HEAT repeat protein